MNRANFLFAVDPSLTSSGWALFARNDGAPLAAGIISPPGPDLALAKRLADLQASVQELFKQLRMGEGDILICEGPAHLVLNPNSALKVERVRGVFETVARSLNVSVPGRLNPRTVHTELLGLSGKQLPRAIVKQTARTVAVQMFGGQLNRLPVYGVKESNLKTMPQDIIDALLVGALAISKVNRALKSGIEVESVFAAKTRLANRRSGRGMVWSKQAVAKIRD